MRFVILPATDREKAKIIWQHIENQVDIVPITAQWDWVETWLDAFSNLVPTVFVYGEDEKGYTGIVLLSRETGRIFPIKNYYIGTAGEPYKDWIHMTQNSILAIQKDIFLRELFTFLKKSYSYEELTCEYFTSGDYELAIGALRNEKIPYQDIAETSWHCDLRAVAGKEMEQFEILSDHTRYRLKRTLRRLENQVVCEYADTYDQAVSIFEAMIPLHQATWEKRGKRGMFASERFTAFHREIIKKLFPKNQIILFRASSPTYGTIGCVYGFLKNNVALMYQSGFNTFDQTMVAVSLSVNQIKPGLLTHALCMRECAKRGVLEYNFGPGDVRYKRELSNAQSELHTISIRNSYKPHLRNFMLQSYYRLEHSKQLQRVTKPLYSFYKKFF